MAFFVNGGELVLPTVRGGRICETRLPDAEGSILIYAMEAPDHERASAAYRNSTLPIDQEHRRIMGQVLGEPANVELLYECVAENNTC